jgi:hypothetical protein
MARKSKLTALADAKSLQAEAEKKYKEALVALTVDTGERMQTLFGEVGAQEAVELLEKELKGTRKNQRLDALRALIGSATPSKEKAPQPPSESTAQALTS